MAFWEILREESIRTERLRDKLKQECTTWASGGSICIPRATGERMAGNKGVRSRSGVRRDLFIAPLLEAALIGVMALAGYLCRSPLIFAALGPTAFEIIETPERPSARPKSILLANLLAVCAGFFALWITRAWFAPEVSAHGVPLQRVAAAMIATMLTVFGTLLLRVSQPAALSTTLLVSLGMMQTLREGGVILGAFCLMAGIGGPLRAWRERSVTLVESRNGDPQGSAK